MGLFEPTLRYEIEDLEGAKHLVAGFQVGLLAVRALGRELHELTDGTYRDVSGGFGIEHWYARASICATRSLAAALVLADELSITAPEVASSAPGVLEAMFERWLEPYKAWVRDVARADAYQLPIPSFRQWRESADFRERVA